MAPAAIQLRSRVARGLDAGATVEPAGGDHGVGLIRGYSVITAGPALGHGFEIDATTMEQIEALGNAHTIGIKSRLGHPAMSEDAIGSELGRSKNFRRSGDGQRVLADLHLSPAAHAAPGGGNPAAWVLMLAQSDPALFGASVVMVGEAVEQLDADGLPKHDGNGEPLPRVFRAESLHASDIVDEPAANPSGFLTAGTRPAHALSAALSSDPALVAFARGFLAQPDALARAGRFLARFDEYTQHLATARPRLAALGARVVQLQKQEGQTMAKPEMTSDPKPAEPSSLEARLQAVEAENASLRAESAETRRRARISAATQRFDEELRKRPSKVVPALRAFFCGEYDEQGEPVIDDDGDPRNLGLAVVDPVSFERFLAAAPGLHSFAAEGGRGVNLRDAGQPFGVSDFERARDERMAALMADGMDNRGARLHAHQQIAQESPQMFAAHEANRKSRMARS